MTYVDHADPNDLVRLPGLPDWVTSRRGESLETVAFLSGSSLAMLHMVLRDPSSTLPAALLRNRLALRAAEACLKLEGRRESSAEIRDAFFLTRPGDATGAASAMGPAGEMFARWRRASALAMGGRDWLARLNASVPDAVAYELPGWIEMAARETSPVAQAARMLGLVLEAFPREEATALICGDMILARAMGWKQTVPLMALHLRRKDLRAAGACRGPDRDKLLLACHRALATAAQDAVRLNHDLARRAVRLRAVAPKLRAKGSPEAVVLFLHEEAVLPSSMLSPRIKGTNVAMTDRAARRLCDRLVDLGVVRELTGRPNFRLYGVA